MDPNLQLVAGPNNAGKSSLVRGLEVFFAAPESDILVEHLPLNDYYRSAGPRTLSQIRVWFDDLGPEEQEEFADAIRSDGRLWVSLRWSRRGTVTHEASRYVSGERAHEIYSSVLERVQFVKIPSVRATSGSGEIESMERLIAALESVLIRSGSTRSTALQQEFATKLAAVEDLVQDVLDQSAESIAHDLPFQEKTVHFRLPPSRHALRGMLMNAVIESLGVVDVPVHQRGTGFQSSLVLGIVRFIASQEGGNANSTVIAIEEPEAFLHPQTQRAMAHVLREISSSTQLLVTTHSSVVVDSFSIRQIARLPLQPQGLTHAWSPPETDQATEGRLTRYANASNSELIFANAAIFVEGESDFPVVEFLLSRVCGAPGGHYARGITVIEAGGSGRIAPLVELAERYRVRSFVMVDRDATHKNGNARRLLDILSRRANHPSDSLKSAICTRADDPCSSLADALKAQQELNDLLSPFDAFILSSDLEGLLVDTFGVEKLLAALGSAGEGAINDQFAAELRGMTNGDASLRLSAWLGSKGWNSTVKPTGKLKPHLPVVVLERLLPPDAPIPDALAPLVSWLSSIAESSKTAAL